MKRLFLIIEIIFLSTTIGSGAAMAKEGQTLDGPWVFNVDSLDRGIDEGWFRTGYDRSRWMEVPIPDHWERYARMEGYDGVGWFACTFEVKKTDEPLSLFFGGVDDNADVWVNGIKIGSHAGYSDPFSMPLDRVLRDGKNEIVVRVVDNSGPGGIYKPITLIRTDRLDRLFRTKYALKNARRSAGWVRDAVIYEVYLRSFSKEGSFKGLEDKIPELKKLGVTVLWLMPIHPVGILHRKGSLGSPYSVQNYYAVNPEFGTLDDFKSLVAAVHRNGLKIIIDLVANHTAWDNPMLKEHPGWYTHDADGNIISPNPDWTDVADLNYSRSGLRKYMIAMMKYWVRDIGIDGFRCDVAEMVPVDFWEAARKELDAIKPVMMLSEGTLPEHHLKAFDCTYSWNMYDVLDKVLSGTTPATIFTELLKSESYQFPRGSLRMRFNSNHDKNAYDGPAVERYMPDGAKATAVLAFTFPGVPLIYNGDEAGNAKRLSLFEKVDIDWSGGKDFRSLFEMLAHFRSGHPALRNGAYMQLSNPDSMKVLSFLRTAGKDSVLVAINFDSAGTGISLALPRFGAGRWQELFTGKEYTATGGVLELRLPRRGYAVLVPTE